MPIVQNISGSADDDSIMGIQVIRRPNGDLVVTVTYRAGSSKQLKLTPSAGFKSSIEATYAEIIAAINEAEGLA